MRLNPTFVSLLSSCDVDVAVRLLRMFSISFVPFSLIRLLLNISLISLLNDVVLTIFVVTSFVEVDDIEDVMIDDETPVAELVLVIEDDEFRLILFMADDEDDVSNERGNTCGLRGRSMQMCNKLQYKIVVSSHAVGSRGVGLGFQT